MTMMTTDVLLTHLIGELEDLGISPARPLLIAFSGGLDSSVLVDLLARYHKRGGPPLELIHIDHGLRPSSVEDARFCRDEARRRGLPITIVELQLSGGGQLAARKKRLAAIAERAICRGINDIAFGHHGDDRIESFLINLRRGAGLDGLAPIAALAPFPYPGADLRALRPLLGCSRQTLERYADKYSLQFITDPTNATDAYARNRLRHHLVPKLADDDATKLRIMRSIANLEAEKSSANIHAERLVCSAALYTPGLRSRAFRRDMLAEAPQATVARIFSSLEPALDAASLDRIYSAICAGASPTIEYITLTRCVITVSAERVEYEPSEERGGRDILERQISPIYLTPFSGGRAPFFDTLLNWTISDRSVPDHSDENPWRADFATDELAQPLRIAAPPPGIRIRRRRRDGSVYHQALSKIFASHDIDHALRWRWPCLLDKNDQLLWAIGLQRAAAAKTSHQTASTWRLSASPLNT